MNTSLLRVRNKNAIFELLTEGQKFEKIAIIENLREDELTSQIIALARKKNIPIERLPRGKMDLSRSGETPEVLVGYLNVTNEWTFNDLLDDLHKKGTLPFFLFLNRVNYANNIGAIARTAFAAGVNGIIYQGERNQFLNDESLHFSLGTLARIPLIKMNIFEALRECKKNNIKTFSLEMDGTTYYTEKLTGAVAFVLGAEGKGVSDTIGNKCDKKLAIPMQGGIDSLNVSASAAIILYEKVRQEGTL